MLKNSMHAMKYLECSAKQMNGVKYVFFEILGAVKLEDRSREQENPNVEMTASQALSDVATKIASSGPLLRLSSLLPFNIFGTEPTPEVNNNNTVKKVTDAVNGPSEESKKDEGKKPPQEKEDSWKENR
ncbi:unnamed protein product [Strongylus vulgaris]|uniref:Uncharacterized protein n=1 Tax=Strongylus vulgaris TaxID=40348 RepID=A0A3P7JCQ7_STRVU|nr:unnamed protein product [Strongylus vulgaris]